MNNDIAYIQVEITIDRDELADSIAEQLQCDDVDFDSIRKQVYDNFDYPITMLDLEYDQKTKEVYSINA